MATVHYPELLAAYEFASAAAPYENRAYVDLDSGRVRCVGADEDERDFDHASGHWVALPHQNHLNVGRNLVFAFAEQHLRADLERVEAYFARLGAFRRFEALLRERDAVELWRRFQAEATAQALHEWCARRVAESRWGPGGEVLVDVVARFGPGNFLVQDSAVSGDDPPWLSAHAVYSFDADAARYGLHWYDATGHVPPQLADGRWDGRALSFVRRAMPGLVRHSYRPDGGDRYATLLEHSLDGGASWERVAEGEYARLGDP